MAKHVLTLDERIRGVRAAIKSSKTMPHLRKPLRQQLTILEQKLRHQRREQRKRKPPQEPGLLDWLGI